MRRALVMALVCAIPAFPAGTPEEPVGLILNPAGAKLVRQDAQTPLGARPGDLLFTGDDLKTAAAPASFLFCPSKAIQTISASGEVLMASGAPKVRSGSIMETPAMACTLPRTLRVAAASQQHYGVTMSRGVSTDFPPVPRDQLAADLKTALQPLDTALTANPEDPGALVASAALFEQQNLPANALEVYRKLSTLWPDAVWVKSKMFELEQAAAAQAAAAAAAGPGGSTYALLIGVSKYKDMSIDLQYPHADASTFADLLKSPLGGAVPEENIMLLTDDKATTAAVRNGFQDFLKRRATKNDTIIILVAGHGTVETPGSKEAYILTYDADPQDLAATSLPMEELQSLFDEQLKNVGRVMLFVDVCKAGTIGSIKNTTVNSSVQDLGDVEGDLFGLLASRPREVSFEGPEFGGGHGAFSYYVMKGMEGAADADGDKVVTASELIDYVSDQVPDATDNKQHPREFGIYDNGMRLSEVDKPGITLARNRLRDARTGGPLFLAQNGPPQPLSSQAAATLNTFNQAIAAGRILPGQANNAFNSLPALQTQLTPERYQEATNDLRVSLEDAAQTVLLEYLAGDDVPQVQADFQQAAQYMEAARMLTSESLLLEARDNFFNGRAMLFDKQFAQAAPLLEQAVRLDPGAAYSYNALGIAYLEQARFDEAIPAFRDAAERAQHWSYPLHNLALSLVETGDYEGAIRAYQKAIELTPDYAYLPYNLGLVYQRLNRTKDAEKSYRKAMDLAPNTAEPYNALGTLKAGQGKREEAEQFYRDALMRDDMLLPARHNLAVLLADQPDRRQEAITLFRENLQRSPDFLASRLSLAETLAAAGDAAGAVQEYRRVLMDTPEYTGARLALARLLLESGDAAGAADEARQALQSSPENFQVYEQLGDAEAAAGRMAEAQAAYQSALDLKPARADRKRIERKMR